MKKLKIGDRVYCGMDDREGKPLNGTIIKLNVLGPGFVLVKCDTKVSLQYAYTDSLDILFIETELKRIET